MLTIINLDDIEDAKRKVNELVEERIFMDALCALREMQEKDQFEEILKLMEVDEIFGIRQAESWKEFMPVINNVLSQKGIGEILTFGSYKGRLLNWHVLDIQDEKKLLVSTKGIDCKPYHSEYKDITWEKCNLRKWLNNEFINEAFSEEEQKRIDITKICNKNNERYHTAGGNDTEDKVFLLSIEEVYKYFADDDDRVCNATSYAKKRGADRNSNGSCWWWLRSPGDGSINAAYVSRDGVDEGGGSVYYGTRAVRPAFWLNP